MKSFSHSRRRAEMTPLTLRFLVPSNFSSVVFVITQITMNWMVSANQIYERGEDLKGLNWGLFESNRATFRPLRKKYKYGAINESRNQ